MLLLVRWRRRERQVVSGLRRKNTEHAHTHARAPERALAPPGHQEAPPRARGSGWCPSFHLEDLRSDPCPWQAPGTAKQHRGSQIFKSQDSQSYQLPKANLPLKVTAKSWRKNPFLQGFWDGKTLEYLFFPAPATLCCMWDLSSPIRDRTSNSRCIGSTESQPLDGQGSPLKCLEGDELWSWGDLGLNPSTAFNLLCVRFCTNFLIDFSRDEWALDECWNKANG